VGQGSVWPLQLTVSIEAFERVLARLIAVRHPGGSFTQTHYQFDRQQPLDRSSLGYTQKNIAN